MPEFPIAAKLLKQFKGDRYLNGLNVLPALGPNAARFGKRAVLVRDCFPGSEPFIKTIRDSLRDASVEVVAELDGAAPNAPRQDLDRIKAGLDSTRYDLIVSFGGGSTIDSAKAANVVHTLRGTIDDYFGTGLVTQALTQSGKTLAPHVAIQAAASSGAHLTKYSNITDVKTGQKKLVVDTAIVPSFSVFDYTTTFGAPPSLTADGALDGISHAVEVLYSAVGKPEYGTAAEVAAETVRLVLAYLPRVLSEPRDPEGRQALGLATDLGGYAIMLGGTNGAHLTSFSLVDIVSHGRACGLMNPYYAVFFAPKIQEPLRLISREYQKAGYTHAAIESLSGRGLGVAAAEAMIAFESAIGFPTALGQIPGFTDAHIDRALAAAKDPQLRMKLENMPVAITADGVDEYMGPILQAAKTGNLALIKNIA